MLQRPTQKSQDEGRLTPRVWSWQGTQRKEVPRSKSGTGQSAELSRLSARLVELSLQQSERDLTLRGPAPNNVTPGSWPFLGTSFDAERLAQTPLEKAETSAMVVGKVAVKGTARVNPQRANGILREWRSAKFAVLYSRMTEMMRGMTIYWTGSAAIGNLRRCWQSVQKDQRFAIFRGRILSRLTLAAKHTDHTRQRAVLLIGHLSRRSARTFQFLTDRISARVKILPHSKPAQRLRNARLKLRMIMARLPGVCAVIKSKVSSAKKYRCPDCGRTVGFRSRPQNLMERYILPLVLTRPVRCAECFRRDYRLILTSMGERSPHHDETDDPHRDAA
jgi:hypothetical protein